MKTLENELAELRAEVAQLKREALRKSARESAPLSPRHGRYVGTTAAADNGDATIDVTAYLYSATDAEWQATATVIENVRAFDTDLPLPLNAKVYVFWYETTWVLLPEHTLIGIAYLSYDMCTDSTSVAIEDFFLLSGSANLFPGTASNFYFKHRGKQGDAVLLVYSRADAAWLIINVEKHAHKVYTNLRQTGSCEHWCVEGYAITAALEVCGDPAWETIYCDPCTTDFPTQTSLQTSTGYTSIPAYGCCVDYTNVAEHNIETVDENGDSVPITDDQPIYLTITQDDDPVVYDDPNPLNYDVEIISPRTADINAALVYPASGPIQSAQLTHPNDPGPYPLPNWEVWEIRCIRRVDPLTGALLFPNDPSQREWVVDGQWGLGESSSATPPQGMMRIFESGVAVYYPAGNNPSSNRFLVTGSVTVHSCDPFHATAHFNIPDSLTAENGNSFESRYPVGVINAGPTSLEFTE